MAERAMGAITAAFGVFLLFVAIPANVVSTGGIILNPALFPKAAAWLLIGLGGLQFALSKAPLTLPPLREVLRFGLVAAVTLVAAFMLRPTGFLVTGIALMAVIAAISFERRLLWLAITVALMPAGIWAFFELLLRRPLP